MPEPLQVRAAAGQSRAARTGGFHPGQWQEWRHMAHRPLLQQSELMAEEAYVSEPA